MRSASLCTVLLLGGGTATLAAAPPDPVALAQRIDKHLAEGWSSAGVEPAAPADDAAFVRRVYLDLVGRIPTVAEARAFLADKSADRHTKLVDALLSSGGHTRHVATLWRRIWIPQADTPRFARLADNLEEWLAAHVAENTPYDALVRELLVAPTSTGRVRGMRQPARGPASQAFVTASESKPENLAANAARAFLGVNLDCAQCHDHPFSKWTRAQFWQTAAFFAPPSAATADKPARLEIDIPGTTKTVTATFLTQKVPADIGSETGAKALADWVTAKDNPFFARNAVNRVWAVLFGTGLVEPLDDLGGANEPSHPELLDELAKAFADSGYNLKYLTKALVLTRAYRMSSAPAGASDPRLFARMPVRGLTGEQLYDTLRVAAGLPVERDDLDPVNVLRERKRFTADFYVERAATAQRSIIQSLSLMNGSTTALLTDPAKTPLLVATANSPFFDTRGQVEALFLATLSRRPTDKEMSSFAKYVETGGSHKDAAKALADVFWALLNSSEFNTNH
jgi:hypothetical protein